MKDIPAFPTTVENYNNMDPSGDGMTLRDYFAAKAMQGLLTQVDDPYYPSVASKAYQLADAMLTAREAK